MQSDFTIIGHKNYQKLFLNLIQKDKLAQTYLFSGPPMVGKGEFAFWLASQILCDSNKKLSCLTQIQNRTQPDLLVCQPSKASKSAKWSIGLKEIKKSIRFLNLSKIASRKILIIRNCECLTNEAANAFLKSLEEPATGTIILLTTSSEENVLPTIASRTQKINFALVPLCVIEKALVSDGLSKEKAELIAKISAGRPVLALELKDPELFQRYSFEAEILLRIINQNLAIKFKLAKKFAGHSQIREILQNWQILIRDMLLAKFELGELIVNKNLKIKIDKTSQGCSIDKLVNLNIFLEEMIKKINQNVSAQLIFENLLIAI